MSTDAVTACDTGRVAVGDVELVYERGGRGGDLIWGHGLTSSMDAEDELALFDWPSVRAVATVVRYDARGHGGSGSSSDPGSYHWASLAADQLALADHLGVDRYVAGGASMGCATALHAAVIAPDRVSALVLAIPPTAWETRAAQTGSYLVSADLLEAGDRATVLAARAQRPGPDPFTGDPRWDDRFERTIEQTDPVLLARVFRGAAGTDLPAPDAIAAIEVPTLILAWTGDAGHPVQSAARLQELMPHAQLALAVTASGLGAWSVRIADFLRAVG